MDSLLKTELKKYAAVLDNPGKYKLQVVYTQIDRTASNVPEFTDHVFRLTKDYVYPASTVKLPVALLTLIKLNELNKPGLNRSTAMLTDSAYFCQKKVKTDTSSSTGLPSLENYIKKMFLISDNYSFARTYEFVGFDYAQKKLPELGFKDIRLFNRLDEGCFGDTAKVTPPVYFLDDKKDTIYKQGLTYFSTKLAHPVKNSGVGKYHRDRGRWVPGPKDFSRHNYLEVRDLHQLMKKIVFNDFATANEKLPIDNESRLFMLKELGLYPRESVSPRYNKKFFYDSYKKYFMYGSAVAAVGDDSVRVINIVGRAYGFLIDCAYIIDLKNNIEFLLTSSIYVNESGRVGSGKYEYDQLGLPFLKDLSLGIYNYERKRIKAHAADLTEFGDLFGYPGSR